MWNARVTITCVVVANEAFFLPHTLCPTESDELEPTRSAQARQQRVHNPRNRQRLCPVSPVSL